MDDISLSVIDVRALPVEEGADHLVLAMLTGIQTPFAGPDGQPVIMPTRIYRVRLAKPAAEELIGSLTAEAEKLPEPKKPSNLFVPGSPDEVDQVAKNLKQFGV